MCAESGQVRGLPGCAGHVLGGMMGGRAGRESSQPERVEWGSNMSDSAVDITSGEVAQSVRPYERYVESLKRQAQADSVNRAFDVAATQIDKILTAQTAEEILGADSGGVVSGQDLVDVELMVRDFSLGESAPEYDATLGVFALIDATNLQTGEDTIVNCGAALVIAKLSALKAGGFLPRELIIRGIKTRNGTLLRLADVPRRAVSQGTTVE